MPNRKKNNNLTVPEVAQYLKRGFQAQGVEIPSMRQIQSRMGGEGSKVATVTAIQEAFQQLVAEGLLAKVGNKFFVQVPAREVSVVESFAQGARQVLHHAANSRLQSYEIMVRETWLPAWEVHRAENLFDLGLDLEGDTEHGEIGFFAHLVHVLRVRSADKRRTKVRIALQAPSEANGLMKRLAQVENLPLESERLHEAGFESYFDNAIQGPWQIARALSSATMVAQMGRCYRNLKAIVALLGEYKDMADFVDLSVRLYTGWSSFPLVHGSGLACKGDYTTYATCWEIPALLVHTESPIFSLCQKDMDKTWYSAIPVPFISASDPWENVDAKFLPSKEKLEKAVAFCENKLQKDEPWRIEPWLQSIEYLEGVRPGTPASSVEMVLKAMSRAPSE